MNPSTFIKEIGRSFFVSCFLPTAFFVSVGVIFFRDIFPQPLDESLSITLFGSDWLLSILLIIWLSFTLYSILPWTLKVYSGYYFPLFFKDWLISSLRRKLHSKRKIHINRLFAIKEKIRSDTSSNYLFEYADCYEKAKVEYGNLELECPISEEHLLPTRLGNLMRSCMIYPLIRYNIDGAIVWPRLLKVLPDEFKQEKDDNEAKLIFMLNSSLLCYLILITSLLIGLIGLPCQLVSESLYCSMSFYATLNYFYNSISSLSYILIGLAFGLSGYIIYRLAVVAGENFVLSVRAGFDLYRFELLEKMNQKMPSSIYKEKLLWAKLNELFVAGDDLGIKPVVLNYDTKKN